MKTRYLGIFLSITLIFLSSCYEDKGNYDYREINEVKISPLKDQTKYAMIDRLTITPDIQYTQNPDGKYGYSWTARSLSEKDKEGNPVDYHLGNEKKLDYFIELNAGDYRVTLTVTDSVSSLKWSNSFKLTVATATYMGWMVLCEDNGFARLDMVEESGETPLYSRNILSYTSLSPRKDPWKMVTFTLDMGGSYEIFMLTGEGCSRLVADDLSWEESNDFRYTLANPSLGNMKVEAMSMYPISGTLMVADGNAYWRQQQGSALFGLPVNLVNGQQVKLAPYIGSDISGNTAFGGTNFVLFDEANRLFLRYAKNSSNCSVLPDFPQGYRLKYLQNTTYNGGTSYAILQQDDGSLRLFPFNANDLTPQALIPLDIPNPENIHLFAFDPLYPYLFYAEGNQLYLYSWTEDKPEQRITPMQNYKQEQITMLKYNSTLNGQFEDSAVYPDRYLLVGTVTTDHVGTLHLLEPQATLTLPTEQGSYSGFSKIIDATYRER